jgi:hypothetical protein
MHKTKLVSCLAYSLMLKMGVICSSQMSYVFQWATWYCIPEDRTLFILIYDLFNDVSLDRLVSDVTDELERM